MVPGDKAYKYAKGTDTITPSARPATQVRSIYAEVLRQTALRVVHEVLEADRGSAVRTVVFNGYVNGTDPATGRQVRPCVAALATSRERFLEVDLARVESAACLTHLEARVSKDPSKFQAVEPIELAGSLEADYTLSADVEPGPGPSSPLTDSDSRASCRVADADDRAARVGCRPERATRRAARAVELAGEPGGSVRAPDWCRRARRPRRGLRLLQQPAKRGRRRDI